MRKRIIRTIAAILLGALFQGISCLNVGPGAVEGLLM